MPALNQDTRLVMTILFVGTVSGANVFFMQNTVKHSLIRQLLMESYSVL